MSPTYHVIFRTCDVVHSVHNTPRPFGLDKRTLIKVCFKSLYASLAPYPHKITILGDRLSPEIQEFFKSYPVTLLNEELGNDNSIRRAFELALEVPDNDWAYICEDDYLHTPQAFLWIDDLIQNKQEYLGKKPWNQAIRLNYSKLYTHPLVIHPPDYPDRYRSRYMRYGLIFLSKFCHWRQISNTTFTFLMEGKTARRYKSILMRSVKGADDGYLSRKLYGGLTFRNKAICLSPIPGVATHMHDGVMTPLVDWQKIADEILRTS